MNWSSWSQFIHMGGYGLYVWGSLGLMGAVMVVEVWQIRGRLHSLRHASSAGEPRGAAHEI